MSTPKTTMSDPLNLPHPPQEPSPVPGCRACLGIVVARTNARSVGDYSKVSDANVVLRTHLVEQHGAR